METEKCLGCHHLENKEGGWCYMFETAPDHLPCAQHDKFAEQRKMAGRLIRDRPDILALMIGSISN